MIKLTSQNYTLNAIIGNPPYQLMVEGNGRAKPIYHLFMDLACQISPRVSLITPARYLFNAGFTPTVWNQKMLNDEHFKVVLYKENSTEVFPSVDIKGGVAVMYRDATQKFGKIGAYTAYAELNVIANKVKGHRDFHEGEFSELISNRGMYRFHESFFEDHPEASATLFRGTGNMIASNAFDLFPDAFQEAPIEGEECIQFYGRCNNQRVYRWIRKDYIMHNPYIEAYNVFVPKSNGSGAIGEVLSTPLIGEPHVGVTDTFISIGIFESLAKAEACLKYIKTKFARTMLGILKVTQDNPKDTWRLVPLQDFTAESDIDWSQSVEEIDRQLYAKYHLDKSEIAFIEEKVRAMN